MSTAASTRSLWAPWMAWADAAASINDLMLSSGEVVAHRGARMAGARLPLSQRDQREFSMMGLEKVQAANDAMLAMVSPLLIHTGALSIKLAEVAWRQGMRNMRLLEKWSPMAFASPEEWATAPLEASAQAMSQAVRQGNYLRASANDAVEAVAHVSRAAGRVAKRGIKPVRAKVKANARRLRGR